MDILPRVSPPPLRSYSLIQQYTINTATQLLHNLLTVYWCLHHIVIGDLIGCHRLFRFCLHIPHFLRWFTCVHLEKSYLYLLLLGLRLPHSNMFFRASWEFCSRVSSQWQSRTDMKNWKTKPNCWENKNKLYLLGGSNRSKQLKWWSNKLTNG